MRHRLLCRRCGEDMEVDAPIRIDEFSMLGDGYPLCFRGGDIHLTPAECTVVWSLLKAYPEYLTKPTLLDRMGSEGYDQLIQVMVCRIRKKFADAGAPDAIETVHRKGYRWRPGGGDGVAERILDSEEPIREIFQQLYAVPNNDT